MSPANKTPILLATTNPAKQQALSQLLKGLPISPVTPQELRLDAVPEEKGDAHHAIARLKAREWSKAANMLAIASDGGIIIPVLGNNWESLYTHRFAGPAADDAERTKRLLELMKSYGGTARAASWVEALAIADRGRILASWENQGASGLIADQPTEIPKGRGFWVFSMWYFPQFAKTYDQLTDEERRALNDHWLQLKDQVQHFFRYEYREEGTSPLPIPPNL